MCFGRLTGAATGLEMARGGAREWVEGQTDRQAPAREMSSKKKNKTKKRTSLSGCQVIFSFREKITLIDVNVDMGNKTLIKK